MISLSKNDGTLTEIIAGIIPGRQGCYFYSSDSVEMYIIYCCVKEKEGKKEVCYTVHKEWYPAPLGPPAEVSSHIISHNS